MGPRSRRSALERLRDAGRALSFRTGTARRRVLVLGSYRPADSATRTSDSAAASGPGDSWVLQRIASRSVVAVEVERYLALRFGDEHWPRPCPSRCSSEPRDSRCLLPRCSNYFIDQRAIVEIDGAMAPVVATAFPKIACQTTLVNMITHSRPPHGQRTASARCRQRSGRGIFCGSGGRRPVARTPSTLNGTSKHWPARINLVPSGVSEWPDGTYSGCYAFRHILYQNIIYQQLAPGHRAQTHSRLGKRLEEAYPGRTPEIALAARASFRAGPRLSKRVALPRAGGGELGETPRSRGSRQLSHPGAWHSRSLRAADH